MKTRLLAAWETLRASYWFIPTLMTLGALALAFGLTLVDGQLGPDWMRDIDLLYANKPDGARALLSTVAGSMIGVAGVTFSITIASVVYASGQYGPRLLTNFMRDTGNQVTLGTFIATFMYCLMVLRTVRSADEAPTGEGPAADVIGAFVPHLSILVAVALALASIAVLIYFIHHTPHSIHVSHVIAGIGAELEGRVDKLFPERIGRGAPGETAIEDGHVRTELPDDFYDQALPVTADRTGYVQGLDGDTLIALARRHDLVLRLRFRPGDFVRKGDALLLAWPTPRVMQDCSADLRGAWTFGRSRNAMQDVRFLVDELVEIAARALSPGVNDPFTAMTCLDWLGAALAGLAGRDTPSSYRYDEEGAVRIIARPTTYAEFAEAAFGQLRPYLAGDRNALFHAFRTIGDVAGHARTDAQRAALREEAAALLEAARSRGQGPRDLADALEHHEVVRRLLDARGDAMKASSETDLAGGTA